MTRQLIFTNLVTELFSVIFVWVAMKKTIILIFFVLAACKSNPNQPESQSGYLGVWHSSSYMLDFTSLTECAITQNRNTFNASASITMADSESFQSLGIPLSATLIELQWPTNLGYGPQYYYLDEYLSNDTLWPQPGATGAIFTR
jgi:hypothetical protein